MKKLTCPSCGGNLELPEHLTVAHCMYCGSKVAVSDDVGNERVSRARYVELLQVADEAGNHEDILHYANAILEIDPENAFGLDTERCGNLLVDFPTIRRQATSSNDLHGPC